MPRAFPFLALLVAACGCGLAEYEERMEETEKRLRRLQEEKEILGGRATLPAKTEKKGAPSVPLARFFLRLPKGIKAVPEKEPRLGFLYVYPVQMSIAAPKGPPPKAVPCLFSEVLIAVNKANTKGMLEKGFREAVVKAIPPHGVGPKEETYTARPFGRDPVKFGRTVIKTPGTLVYSINIWNSSKEQIAICYAWNEGRQAEEAKAAANKSLDTFAAGPEMAKEEERYRMGMMFELVPRTP